LIRKQRHRRSGERETRGERKRERHTHAEEGEKKYRVATMCWLLKIIGLFCKRAL